MNVSTVAPDPDGPAGPAAARDEWSSLKPLDVATLETILVQLARAVHQLHTLPPTNPLCVDAIAAVRRSFAAVRYESFPFQVTGDGLSVGQRALASGPFVEPELVRRLRRCRVVTLTIERAASARDLTLFCRQLIRCSESGPGDQSLLERLTEDGVTAIAVKVALHPEVLAVSTPTNAQRDLVEREHQRRAAADRSSGEPTQHLFPPDKGWVRIDPASSLDRIALGDLAILVDDPTELAVLLARLTNDAAADAEDAFERRFTDVAALFASLEPRLARLMFAKLARAVLGLSSERRQRLLKRAVLPALLDGEIEGSILADFPDVDLADALCLLLDLETAAPEVVLSTLDRLDLTPERRQSVAPLVEERVEERRAAISERTREADANLDKHARRLTKVDAVDGKNFSEFASFDLALDEPTRATIDRLIDVIAHTDALGAEVPCLLNLVRIQPNPETAQGLLTTLIARFDRLAQTTRWRELADALMRLGDIRAAVASRRDEIATAIDEALAAYCTTDRARTLLELHARDESGQAAALEIIDALGAPLAAPFTALLAETNATAMHRALVSVMSDRAAMFAPTIVAAMPSIPPAARHAVVRILGFAGAGHEALIAEQIRARDERTTREALRALARIATAQAASLVAARVGDRESWIATAALEALWRFPEKISRPLVRARLMDRNFARQHPKEALSLLERAARGGTTDLTDALRMLSALRFTFWRPDVVRLARTASSLLSSHS